MLKINFSHTCIRNIRIKIVQILSVNGLTQIHLKLLQKLPVNRHN